MFVGAEQNNKKSEGKELFAGAERRLYTLQKFQTHCM